MEHTVNPDHRVWRQLQRVLPPPTPKSIKRGPATGSGLSTSYGNFHMIGLSVSFTLSASLCLVRWNQNFVGALIYTLLLPCRLVSLRSYILRIDQAWLSAWPYSGPTGPQGRTAGPVSPAQACQPRPGQSDGDPLPKFIMVFGDVLLGGRQWARLERVGGGLLKMRHAHLGCLVFGHVGVALVHLPRLRISVRA